MRKTIVETLFSLNHKNKLFEKKNFNRKKSVPKVTDKSILTKLKHISDFIGFFGANYGNSGC